MNPEDGPDKDLARRFDHLQEILSGCGSVVVAYSGGVDSTFLARVARDCLRDKMLAVTACSETYPEWERREATRLAGEMDLPHRLVETSELDIPGFARNPRDRCYHCKRELFSMLHRVREELGFACVADGTTMDDTRDHRPGRRAASELRVRSPLLEAGLTKRDVRELSRGLKIKTWDKPAFACLASRFPYGEEISAKKLSQVEAAEAWLRGQGVRQFRVRHHGEVARVEVPLAEIPRLATDLREGVSRRLHELGFTYVALDLDGYRTGSMNESRGG